jgi:uncharacterized SAM-binding protein YcdF (DUF218 family)
VIADARKITTMKIMKAVVSLFVLALLIVTALFVDFTYKTFSARPRLVQADAIVVLAGGKGRVEEGVRLFRDRRAHWLFLVGVDPTVRKSDLYRPQNGDPSSENVVLEKQSRNTLENAMYGRDLIVEHNVRTVLLITSRYHLKRSAILFHNALPPTVTVYPYPVDSQKIKEDWWYHVGTFRLLFTEFYKYCLFRTFFLFSPGELQPVKL